MKLRLEVDEDVTTLVVSENIAPTHFPVLKAGLRKLIFQGKLLTVLDLSELNADALLQTEVAKELQGLPHWAIENGGQLALVTTAPGCNGFATRPEAVKSLRSPLAKLAAQEAKLELQLKTLEAQKAELQKKIDALAGQPDIRSLRRENSEFKTTIVLLEEHIERYMGKRTEPYAAPALKSKQDTLVNLLTAILEQEGAILAKQK